MPPTDPLARLSKVYSDLTASERRVADFVLADPEPIPYHNLGEIAEAAGVSEPTVLRFCRSLDLDGFSHFKVALASSLAAGGVAYVHRDVTFDDDLDALRSKLFQSSISMLTKLEDSLDMDAIETVVDRICAARRVQLYAVGVASILTQDTAQKLMRLDVACEPHPDAHIQMTGAATLGPKDVAIAFCYNGRVKDVVHASRTAREGGAHTVAITRPRSPLASAVDTLIAVEPREDTFLYAPMSSRIAHLMVIDVMTTMVALKRGPAIVPQLERIKESLATQWERERPRRRSSRT